MRIVATAAVVAAVTGWAFVYLGVCHLAADFPHTRPVLRLLEAARNRSVAMRARHIRVPVAFEEPKRIAAGGGLYDDMYANCHLAHGMEKTEISQGLFRAHRNLANPAT